MKDNLRLADSYNMIAIYNAEIGKLNESLDYFQKSLELYGEIEKWNRYTILLNNIGEIYWRLGDYNKAFDTFNNTIAISKERKTPYQIAVANRFFGLIFASLGEHDKALPVLQKDLELFEKVHYNFYLETLHYIGIIHWQRGDEEEAISLLTKCVSLREKSDQLLLMSFSLFELITIFTEKNKVEQSNFYFAKLKYVNDKLENRYVNLSYRLSEAMILLNSESHRNKIKAEYLLEQIIEEPIIFFPYTIDAISFLCEFYLNELIFTGDRGFLNKLNNLVNQLSEISKKQRSFSLIVDVLWLKSQLALFDYDTKTSLGLLVQAQQLAKEKGLERHYEKFTNELDALNQSLSKWRKLKEDKSPASELLKHIRIDKSIESIKIDKTFNAQSVTFQQSMHLKHNQ